MSVAGLVQALAASALLMALVLLARRPVRRLVGAEVAYALWALPAVRLLVPPLPASWHAPPLARAGETVTVLIVDAAPAAGASVGLPLASILVIGWAAGAALLLGGQAFRHRRFCYRLLACAIPLEVRDSIRIVASATAPGPLAFGIRRRYVVLPADAADRYTPAERALAVAHELAHHARGDLLANWAALIVLALHWWNPLAWIALRAFRADQELATDARVLAGRSPADTHAYAQAIVKAASPLASPAPAACLHSVTDLKRRLLMLSTRRPSRRHFAAGTAATALLIGGGLALTATSSGAAAAVASVDAALQEAPPALSAPPAAVAPLATPATPATPRIVIDPGKARKVIVVRNGKATTYDAADIDAHLAAGDRVAIAPLAPGSHRMIVKADGDPQTRVEIQDVPAVSEAVCGIGNGKPASMVVDSGRGPKRMIVVCTDRIAAMTADVERNAMGTARSSLEAARAAIAGNRNLTDAQRSEALAGIAQAERELVANGFKAD